MADEITGPLSSAISPNTQENEGAPKGKSLQCFFFQMLKWSGHGAGAEKKEDRKEYLATLKTKLAM